MSCSLEYCMVIDMVIEGHIYLHLLWRTDLRSNDIYWIALYEYCDDYDCKPYFKVTFI